MLGKLYQSYYVLTSTERDRFLCLCRPSSACDGPAGVWWEGGNVTASDVITDERTYTQHKACHHTHHTQLIQSINTELCIAQLWKFNTKS